MSLNENKILRKRIHTVFCDKMLFTKDIYIAASETRMDICPTRKSNLIYACK